MATTTVYSKDGAVRSYLTPPARPLPPTLAKKDVNTLTINWTGLPNPATPALKYELMRHISPGAPDPNFNIAGWDNALPPPGDTAALTFDDASPGLLGHTWVYVISARNASGVSPYSILSIPENM